MNIVYDIETAKHRLNKFHMILRTETLSEENYWNRMTHILDAKDIMTKTIQRHANKGTIRPNNATSEEYISVMDMKRLQEWNIQDYALINCLFGN